MGGRYREEGSGVAGRQGTPSTDTSQKASKARRHLDLMERVSSFQRLVGDQQNEKKVFHKAQSKKQSRIVKLYLSLFFGAKMFSIIKLWR